MRMFAVTLALAGTALALAACGSDSATGPGGDTVLESVSPAAGATGVDPSSPIMVRFGGPMAAGMEQYVDLHQGGTGGAIVPMSCSFSADRTTLTCNHGQPLQSGATFTIHVGSGMMDANGHQAEVEQHAMGMGGQVVTGQMM
ncbi:MAG TPA: Ig-like domain-containing protein, partial [Gemmatimonadales bacterium]|nr:Ig-like domain-containing protein [Gemmatimonadales bacterium]